MKSIEKLKNIKGGHTHNDHCLYSCPEGAPISQDHLDAQNASIPTPPPGYKLSTDPSFGTGYNS